MLLKATRPAQQDYRSRFLFGPIKCRVRGRYGEVIEDVGLAVVKNQNGDTAFETIFEYVAHGSKVSRRSVADTP